MNQANLETRIPAEQESPAKQHNETLLPIAETANYQGNWTELQLARMVHPDFRAKFNRFIDTHAESLKPGEPSSWSDRPEHFQNYYIRQKDSYDDTLETVYSSVVHAPAREVGGLHATSLGHGKFGNPATVYSDAETLDNDRKKDIIAAHEAYHGVVDARGSASEEVRMGFDWQAYNERVDETKAGRSGYLRTANELMARMAQLKNYYGMDGEQAFTAEHLEYAREHYTQGTELDNSMTEFFTTITPNTQDEFISLMNRLPV